MNSRAVINILIFTLVLIGAIMLGNAFLSFILHRPIEQVPTFAKVVVHGISLGFIFYVLKKMFVH